MELIGRKRWAIAEGYIPSHSNGPHPQMTSHETACLLNVGNGMHELADRLTDCARL